MGEYWDAFPPGPSPQLWWSWGSGWDAIMRGWHAMRSAYVVFDVLRLLIVGGVLQATTTANTRSLSTYGVWAIPPAHVELGQWLG